jgi:hypothetical protein
MNAPTQIDQYDFWRRRIKGEELAGDLNEPQAGFYRNRSDAVAYWFDKEGQLRCRVNDVTLAVDAHGVLETWPFASKRPVTHEAYKAKLATGNWPSESKAVSEDIVIARTDPNANTFEGLQRRIGLLKAAAEAMVQAGGAKTEDVSDAAADIADRLSKLCAAADNARKVEKQPHLDACRDVDDKWRAVIAAAEFYKRVKAVVCEPFLKAQKAEQDKAIAEARRKAEEARLAAEEAALKAAQVAHGSNAPNELVEQAAADAKALAEAAAANAAHVAAQTVTAGTRGRSIGLRKNTVVIIEDREKVLAFFHDREEITALLQTMAEKAIKAGIAVPGTKVDKEEKAA